VSRSLRCNRLNAEGIELAAVRSYASKVYLAPCNLNHHDMVGNRKGIPTNSLLWVGRIEGSASAPRNDVGNPVTTSAIVLVLMPVENARNVTLLE
jgi:hypothetical protein